ncbi:MAG: zinc ABC transporter substrate-binding protein [Burkholderiales bacterium]|jgi:zinc/manganese transport system substrate-binding protein|nr:zinc ABC transporter substrate-binding protein [Burkholderiales bacterium]
MKSRIKLLLAALSLLIAGTAHAAIDVFACSPEWGALTGEIAGNRATVFVATTALQDIHRIQARPSLIARARTAALVICTGADLEVGWMSMVQSQSGNDRIQVGKPGFLEVANFVPRIDIPGSVDRALGDVHPLGNPHIQFGPKQIQLAAEELTRRLVRIDPAGEGEYRARLTDFTSRWSAATQRWLQLGAPLKGITVIQHHKNFSYLFDFLGMRQVGSLEPKPGVEPTSAHLSDLVEQQKVEPAKLIVRASYQSPAASEWLAQRIKVPAVMLPATVGGSEGAKDLFSLYDDCIRRLLTALPG